LFDPEVRKEKVVRSNHRRQAVIISKEAGMAMTKKINEEIAKE
jgi:hypothetical protein